MRLHFVKKRAEKYPVNFDQSFGNYSYRERLQFQINI